MASFYLSSLWSSSGCSALGEPFGHVQGWYLPLHLAQGPVLLPPLHVSHSPSSSSWGKNSAQAPAAFQIPALSLCCSSDSICWDCGMFYSNFGFLFYQEKPHHSLSWLGRLPQGVSSLKLFEASVTAQILNPFYLLCAREALLFLRLEKDSSALILQADCLVLHVCFI